MGSCDLLSVQCPGPTFVYPTSTTCAQFLFTPRYMAYIAVCHQTRSGDGDESTSSAKARCRPTSSPLISDWMLKRAVIMPYLVRVQFLTGKSIGGAGHGRPPGALVLGIPHIAPGDVHMSSVWCGQPKKWTTIPPSGFVIKLITFCPPVLILLDLS